MKKLRRWAVISGAVVAGAFGVLCGVAEGRAVYVVDVNLNLVYQYSIAQDGSLAPMQSLTVATGSAPFDMALTPSGGSAYVVNTNNVGDYSTVSQYSAGPDGALTALSAATVPAGVNSRSIAVAPSGENVYVPALGGNTVWQYSVSSGGSLTPVAPPITQASGPFQVAISPDGDFAYASNYWESSISEYAVAGDGSLSALESSTVFADGTSSAMAVSPSGAWIWSASSAPSGTMSQYSIASDGELAPLSPPSLPFPTINAGPMAVSPDGSSVYVGTWGGDPYIVQYSVSGGGSLTPAATQLAQSGSISSDLDIDPSGRFLYSVGKGGQVNQLSVGAGGSLVPGGTTATPGNSAAAVAVQPAQGPTAALSITSSTTMWLSTFDASGTEFLDVPVQKTFTFDFGDGTTPVSSTTASSATHEYQAPGTYVVTTTAASDGCSNQPNVIFTGQTAYCNPTQKADFSRTVYVTGAPQNIVPPSIAGTPQVGDSVVCKSGTWVGATDSYTYQWLVDGQVVPGATDQAYMPQAADSGGELVCWVTASNDLASNTVASAAVTIMPKPEAAPQNTSPPVVSGDLDVGSTLGCSQGSWTGAPNSYAYQWYRSGQAVAGTAGSSYVVTSADQGASLACKVTASNGGGNTSAFSNAIVIAPAPAPAPASNGVVVVPGNAGQPGKNNPAALSLDLSGKKRERLVGDGINVGVTCENSDCSVVLKASGRIGDKRYAFKRTRAALEIGKEKTDKIAFLTPNVYKRAVKYLKKHRDARMDVTIEGTATGGAAAASTKPEKAVAKYHVVLDG